STTALSSPTSFFCFHAPAPLGDLHSFPTRRSSDLGAAQPGGGGPAGRGGGGAAGRDGDLHLVRPPGPRASHAGRRERRGGGRRPDRKSTRLNSSHDQISYAVFCLKKKKNDKERQVV